MADKCSSFWYRSIIFKNVIQICTIITKQIGQKRRTYHKFVLSVKLLIISKNCSSLSLPNCWVYFSRITTFIPDIFLSLEFPFHTLNYTISRFDTKSALLTTWLIVHCLATFVTLIFTQKSCYQYFLPFFCL